MVTNGFGAALPGVLGAAAELFPYTGPRCQKHSGAAEPAFSGSEGLEGGVAGGEDFPKRVEFRGVDDLATQRGEIAQG